MKNTKIHGKSITIASNKNPKKGEKNMKDEKKNVKPGVIASTKNNTVKAPVKKMAPVETKVEKKPAEVKAAPKAPAKPAKIEKGSKIKDLLAFCEPLFAKGIKESELMEKLAAKFPETAAATFKTQVYKCRSTKYTKLEKLVVKGKDGILKFA